MTSNTSKPKAAYVDEVEYNEQLDTLPSSEEVDKTVEALEDRGFNVVVVQDESEALSELISRIPADATIMNGHSTTLEEIGFVDYLIETDHEWQNLHDEIFEHEDSEELNSARREAQTAEYFLGSVNAIAKSGELVSADASGSRIGAYPFAAENLILVSGTNKIVDDLDTARNRLSNVAYQFEDARAQDEYGMESVIAKEFIYHYELNDERTTLILIHDRLGF